jgi:hypothetical protein
LAKIYPKHVELILEINKMLLLHLVGVPYYFTYIFIHFFNIKFI